MVNVKVHIFTFTLWKAKSAYFLDRKNEKTEEIACLSCIDVFYDKMNNNKKN